MAAAPVGSFVADIGSAQVLGYIVRSERSLELLVQACRQQRQHMLSCSGLEVGHMLEEEWRRCWRCSFCCVSG